MERHQIVAVPLTLAKPINETPVALVADFDTGHRQYQVQVMYDPKFGLGTIRIAVAPFQVVE
jgi:hypothetical protein